MKNRITSLLLALSLLSAVTPLRAETIEMEVNGLVCAFCAQGIEKQLRRLPATEDVLVSLEHRLVAVSLVEGAPYDEQAMRGAITEAGYATVKLERSAQSLDDIRARLEKAGRP